MTSLKPATAALKEHVITQHVAKVRKERDMQEYAQAVRAIEDASPTAHRLSKGGLSLEAVYNTRGIAVARQYRSKGAVDHYRDAWPDDVSTAFSAYIADAHTADQMGITINYDGNSTRSSHGKIGGLGNVHDRQRLAFARLEWINQRLTWRSVEVLRWLVLEVKREATGKSFGLTEVGHHIFPAIRDKATAKGIAIGRLLGAGEELARWYRIHETISRDGARERGDAR